MEQGVTEALGEILVELGGLDEGFYDLPASFKKPKSYPGINGAEWKAAMAKGIVDLGLVDPDKPPGNVDKLRSTVLRSVVKLLIASKGDNAYINDPEGVLPKLFGYVKPALEGSIEEAFSAMYDTPIAVDVKGVKTKKGIPGWRFHVPKLHKFLPTA